MVRLETFIFRQPPAYQKKKKKETQNLIKKKPAAYPRNKRRKKNKNPKTQTVFPDQNLDYRFFATPSNTQIGLACSNLSNTNPL